MSINNPILSVKAICQTKDVCNKWLCCATLTGSTIWLQSNPKSYILRWQARQISPAIWSVEVWKLFVSWLERQCHPICWHLLYPIWPRNPVGEWGMENTISIRDIVRITCLFAKVVSITWSSLRASGIRKQRIQFWLYNVLYRSYNWYVGIPSFGWI